MLENKLFNAPVFYHAPQRTDFFCTMHTKGDTRIILRELDNFYTVGQIEPKLEVYKPQSRDYEKFIKQLANAYIIRFLQENSCVLFSDVCEWFGYIGEPILKKGLKDIEVEIDRNGECKFTESFDAERF